VSGESTLIADFGPLWDDVRPEAQLAVVQPLVDVERGKGGEGATQIANGV
jgi:hypothetical protein